MLLQAWKTMKKSYLPGATRYLRPIQLCVQEYWEGAFIDELHLINWYKSIVSIFEMQKKTCGICS